MPVRMLQPPSAEWPSHLPAIRVTERSISRARLRLERKTEKEIVREALANQPESQIRIWRCEITQAEVIAGRARERQLIEEAVAVARRRRSGA